MLGDRSLSEFFMRLIFPRKCPLCSAIIPHCVDAWFCDDCAGKVTLIGAGSYCKKCGRAYKGAGMCRSCVVRAYPFVKNRAVSVYDEAMQYMIYKFKYGKHSEYGRSLGIIMANKYPVFFDERIDLIIPVPLHRKRLTKRGFNQSELLSREISAATGISMCKNALIRMKDTKPQSSLNPDDRKRNVEEAFKFNKLINISGKNILLVDDIFTTGSTLSACARLLLINGAENVFGYTLSITD